ncbi:hypothetical protein Tco_1440093 [Tanacetum coccineum]
MASQDARLSKFEADFKQQQGEMTNKINTVLKAITDRIAGALPSDTIDIEEPLDLVNTSEESVYESLIKEMPKYSLNYDFKIKKGDPRNLKIPCMIGHKFTANAYIDVDLLMNLMSLAYYNSIRKNRYEYKGGNFIGLGRDMHVFVGSMSYVIDFTILENIETNIDLSLSHVIFGGPFLEIACLAINRKHGLMTFTDGTKEITFKTPYKDPERSELSIECHDLLSSRIILSEDDYDRGCSKPSDLEKGFYRDTIKLGPEYVTGMDDKEVTKWIFKKRNKKKAKSKQNRAQNGKDKVKPKPKSVKEKVMLVQASSSMVNILNKEVTSSWLDPEIPEDALAEVHNHDNMNNNVAHQAVQVMPSSQ